MHVGDVVVFQVLTHRIAKKIMRSIQRRARSVQDLRAHKRALEQETRSAVEEQKRLSDQV